jgi:hypothetical protein
MLLCLGSVEREAASLDDHTPFSPEAIKKMRSHHIPAVLKQNQRNNQSTAMMAVAPMMARWIKPSRRISSLLKQVTY